MILKDVLKPNLDIVFCGTAVGVASAKKKAYYAGPGNQFFPILYKTKLIPHQIQPTEYQQLLYYNLGLTDMVKHTSGNDHVLNDDDFDVRGFKDKILKYQPKILCFNGKRAAASFLNEKRTKNINYGFLSQKIGATRCYVAPSTSGSARRFWDERFWFKLKELI